jgi:hypothetical protein
MGFDRSRKTKRTRERAKQAVGEPPGKRKVKKKKLLGNFESAVPVLRDLGYNLSEVSIKLGVPPGLVATFTYTRDVSDEEVTAALRENANHRLIKMLIRMLSKARKFQSGMRIAGLKAQSTSVDISLLPGVSVKFA